MFIVTDKTELFRKKNLGLYLLFSIQRPIKYIIKKKLDQLMISSWNVYNTVQV